MNMPARAPVMPLAQTREEINATAAALRHLAAIWGECFSSVQLDKRAVERVCIVGSGDSSDGGTMCRRPAGEIHTSVLFRIANVGFSSD